MIIVRDLGEIKVFPDNVLPTDVQMHIRSDFAVAVDTVEKRYYHPDIGVTDEADTLAIVLEWTLDFLAVKGKSMCVTDAGNKQCRYSGTDGRRCAVAVWLDAKNLELCDYIGGISTVFEREHDIRRRLLDIYPDKGFWSHLQSAHDDAESFDKFKRYCYNVYQRYSPDDRFEYIRDNDFKTKAEEAWHAHNVDG